MPVSEDRRGFGEKMRAVKLVAGAVVLLALAVWCWSYYQANTGFTRWMSLEELNQWQTQFDTNPPGGHPNFWDKGHWMTAVEGRWHDGIPQYRVRYGDVPKGNSGVWWYWYINQDQASFSAHVHELADQGFVLCDPNSFLRPDDSRRYQGVWHKLEKKKAGAASAPASH